MNFTQESAPNTAGYGYGTGYMYNILLWTGPEYDLRDYKDYWLVPNEKQNWHYTDWYDNPDRVPSAASSLIFMPHWV